MGPRLSGANGSLRELGTLFFSPDGRHLDVVGGLKGSRSSGAVQLADSATVPAWAGGALLRASIALPLPGRGAKGVCAPSGHRGLMRIGVGGPDFNRPADPAVRGDPTSCRAYHPGVMRSSGAIHLSFFLISHPFLV